MKFVRDKFNMKVFQFANFAPFWEHNFHPSCFCKIFFVDTLLLIMFMGFIDNKKREAKSYWLKFW